MKRISIIALTMVSVMLAASMTALADDDSSHIVMVSPSGVLNEGETAKLEVHVFDKDQYTTPTAITASELFGSEISLSEKSTGIWAGSMDAQSTMISAEASISEKSDSTMFMMQAIPKDVPEEVEISIGPKDENALVNPQPGDKLDFTIEIYKDGKLKDDTSLEVTITNWNSYDPETLAKNKVSTGIYETSFTIPQLTESTFYEIEATITDASADFSFDINFYQVWVHKGAISTTDASFDLYVADSKGKAVKGAIVKLEYSYEQTDGGQYIEENAGQATTDDSGKAPYTVSYSKVDRSIYLDGTVEADGKTQRFSGSFIITSLSDTSDEDPDDPMGWGFEVIYQLNAGEILKPNVNVNLEFKAWMTEGYFGTPAPWTSKDVYYYVYTYTSVIKFGKVTTDANGILTLSFKTPGVKEDVEVLYIDFTTEKTVGEWEESAEYLIVALSSIEDIIENPEKLRDNEVKISVDTLKVGGESKITATYSKAKKESYGQVGWLPGKLSIADMMEYGDTQPDWEQLTGGDTPYMTKKGTTFSASIIIPEFMPKTTYTIYVLIIDPYEGSDMVINIEQYIHANYIRVEAGKGATTPDPDEDKGMLGLGKVGSIDVALILMLVIILVVVFVVIILIARRRKEAPPMGPHGQYAYGTQPVQPHHGHEHPPQHQPPAGQSQYESPPPPPPAGGGPTDQQPGSSAYETPPPPPAAGAPPPDTQQGDQQYSGPPPAP